MSKLTELDGAHAKCVFLARYRKIGVNQWRRIGRPEIVVSLDDWAIKYREPVVFAKEKRAEVFLQDNRAVNFKSPDLLGDFTDAADRCDKAFRNASGDVILDNLSDW